MEFGRYLIQMRLPTKHQPVDEKVSIDSGFLVRLVMTFAFKENGESSHRSNGQLQSSFSSRSGAGSLAGHHRVGDRQSRYFTTISFGVSAPYPLSCYCTLNINLMVSL